ncbi:MAG: thioredoxin family protein [Gemmataceae bacterium]
MRSVVIGFVAAVAFSFVASPVVRADDDKADKLWITSFEDAKKTAAMEKLDIMMEFTGSDWCPPCIALHDNVLTKETFTKTAPKKFVLLKLDNPRDKSKQTEEEKLQYKKLSKKFNVSGVPTVFLVDAKGRPYAKFVGYSRAMSAEVYTNRLVEATKTRAMRDEYFAKAAKAKGLKKAKLLAKGIGVIGNDLALAFYRNKVDQIIELDTDNKAELKNKFVNMVKAGDVKKALSSIQQKHRRDAKAGTKAIEKLIANEKLEGAALQEALYIKAMYLYQQQDKEASKAVLEEAVEAAPDTAKAATIRRILSRVFKD